MGIFKSKSEKELDEIIARITVNMQNNYKDNAQSAFKDLGNKLEELRAEGKTKASVLDKYTAVYKEYEEKLQGYSHKDQKPYWT